jgi:hypothetical protein
VYKLVRVLGRFGKTPLIFVERSHRNLRPGGIRTFSGKVPDKSVCPKLSDVNLTSLEKKPGGITPDNFVPCADSFSIFVSLGIFFGRVPENL